MGWNFGDNRVTKFASACFVTAVSTMNNLVVVTMKILAPRQFPSHIASE
jgi:hypothetical protein